MHPDSIGIITYYNGYGKGLACVKDTGLTIHNSGALYGVNVWGHGNDPYEHSDFSFMGCGKRILDNTEYGRIRPNKGEGAPDDLRKYFRRYYDREKQN